MVLSGHLTKLEAVNDMLWTIGESPVQSIGTGLGDAAIAEAVLDRVSREVQLKGWHVNTLRNYTLSKNSDNQFVLPADTLRVDTVDPTGGRRETTPSYSSHIDAVMRRSSDGTTWLMFDKDNNTETWDTETELTTNIVKFLEYENLTPALQVYIWNVAAQRFQNGAMGSKVLFEITDLMVTRAETQAVQEDTMNEDVNILRDNPHVRSVVHRRNPGYNI